MSVPVTISPAPPPSGGGTGVVSLAGAGLSIGDVLLLVLGAGVLGSGFWLLSRARKTPIGELCSPALPLVGAVRRSTMYTLAMGVMVLGYHIAAWTIPSVLGLHVPGHRAWILVAALVLTVGGSLWAERIERGTPR